MRKMKRFLALLIMGCALSTVSAVGADIVVLMDSSGTILPWFDEINGRILVDITRKFVREGDTFHLVSFNSRVNLEIAQPVETEADISRIVSRFMLLYPLGQNSDFLSGLQYILQYVSSLDTQREKIIIVISDGIFNPPPSSPYASFSTAQIRDELSATTRKIRGAGWNVYYIKLPFPENAEIRSLDGNLLEATTAAPTGKESSTESKPETESNPSGKKDAKPSHEYYDISEEFTSDLDIPSTTLPESGAPLTFVDQVFSMPEVEFPEDLGKKGRFFVLPLKVKNNSDHTLNMELNGVFTENDVNLLSKNSFLNVSPKSTGTLKAEISIPETFKNGSQDISMRLQFSNNLRVLPQSSKMHVVLKGFSFGQLFRTGSSLILSLLLVALAAILVIFLFFFILRRTSRPAADAIRNASSPADEPVQNRTVNVQDASAKGRQIVSAKPGMLESGNASAHSVQKTAAAPAGKESARSSSLLSGKPSSDSASVLANSASRTTAGVAIDYHQEKKVYPTAASAAPDTSAKEALKALASSQSDDQNKRFAVLSSAVIRKTRTAEHRKGAVAGEAITIRGSGRVMVELSVHNQNPNIGKRNIHMLKAGTRLSLGGGQSSFLVFLVKFPANIAELRFDGQTCSLAILKPEYFPNESDNIIHDCIGRNFVICSDRDYEVTFDFRLYEDPVTKLNRLLTSINY